VERARGTLVIKPLGSQRRAAPKRKRGAGNPRLVVGDPDELVHFDWSKHWKPRL
jgi:hypothetical protein